MKDQTIIIIMAGTLALWLKRKLIFNKLRNAMDSHEEKLNERSGSVFELSNNAGMVHKQEQGLPLMCSNKRVFWLVYAPK